MSASIQTGATSFDVGRAVSTPGGGAFSGEVSGGARPQVQSRRVSLKVGPFGLTYATDQVLWPEAGQDEAAATPAELGQAGQTGQAQAAPQQASAQSSTQDAQQAAEASARSFSQELHQAWRRQVEDRVQSAQGYGPDARQPAAASAASQASGQSTEKTASATARPAASAMRRAIAAYLANASEFSQARPMINATA